MSDRDADLIEDARGYHASFIEHIEKITANFKDRTMQFAINGWIHDCRHFATKESEILLKLLERGVTVNIKLRGGRKTYASKADVNQWLEKWMPLLDRLEGRNNNRR